MTAWKPDGEGSEKGDQRPNWVASDKAAHERYWEAVRTIEASKERAERAKGAK